MLKKIVLLGLTAALGAVVYAPVLAQCPIGGSIATASGDATNLGTNPAFRVYTPDGAGVNNNTAGRNTISGFDRHADGTLTPIAGTPFDAGAAGAGAPTGSAGALQLSGDGRYLLAVDVAANEIWCSGSGPTGRFVSPISSHPMAEPRSASRSIAISCTSPIPGPEAATTAGSGSVPAAI